MQTAGGSLMPLCGTPCALFEKRSPQAYYPPMSASCKADSAKLFMKYPGPDHTVADAEMTYSQSGPGSLILSTASTGFSVNYLRLFFRKMFGFLPVFTVFQNRSCIFKSHDFRQIPLFYT